jgi:hypothetical protein
MFTKSSRGNMKDRMSAPGHVALLAFGLMMAFALVSMPVVASVADGAVSDSDAKCLKCHSKKLKKSLEDGQKLSLHVPVAEFAESVHSTVGCTSCHQGIADRKHPKTKVAISSERAYSVEMNQVCGDCHETKIKQYEGSIHASLVADGNHTAPVCTDCHSAHAVKAMAMYEPVTGQSCKTCHGEIFEAYAQSVHGEARTNGNVIRASHIQAPICADCHRAHETTAVAAGELVQSTCLSCHDEASLAHEQWLPNAGHHLEMVSCAACHAPMAERRIDLQLFDKLTQVPVGQDDNHAAIPSRLVEIDEAGDGLDPIELWKLVRQTSQEGKATDVTLRGRMEVSTGADAHRLAVKTSAVRECNSCHENGSSAFQNVTVSISRPDGRKQRYEADSEVLTSAVSVDAVRGFYAAGGTRIKLLDGLLILGIIGGLAVPIGHVAVGKILKNKL